MEWISVKDRLPEKGVTVLITDGKSAKEGKLSEVYPDGRASFDCCGCCYDVGLMTDVTYWGYLKDLPK